MCWLAVSVDKQAEPLGAAAAKSPIISVKRLISCPTYCSRLHVNQHMAEHLLPLLPEMLNVKVTLQNTIVLQLTIVAVTTVHKVKRRSNKYDHSIDYCFGYFPWNCLHVGLVHLNCLLTVITCSPVQTPAQGANSDLRPAPPSAI